MVLGRDCLKPLLGHTNRNPKTVCKPFVNRTPSNVYPTKRGGRTVCGQNNRIVHIDVIMKLFDSSTHGRFPFECYQWTRSKQRGCVDHIVAVQQIRCKKQQEITVCSIEFKMAFDSNDGESFLRRLLADGIPPKIVSFSQLSAKTHHFSLIASDPHGHRFSSVLFKFRI